MKTSIDYFDLAVKNTFVKTSKISRISSPSFSSLHSENENNEGLSNAGSKNINSESKNGTVELQSRLEPSEIHHEVSYAAKALEEIENLRKMNINDTINQRVQRMTQFEEKLRARMKANLLLNKEEMNIKDRLMWNISESSVSDDDLISSQKFSTLLKRYSDQKWKEHSEVSQRKSAELQNNLNETRQKEINKIEADFAVLQEKMKKDVEQCKNCSKLRVAGVAEFKKVKEFSIALKNILLKTKININDGDIDTSRLILHWLSLLATSIRKIIDSINEEEDRAENAKILSEETDSKISKPVDEKFENDQDKCNVCDYVCKSSLDFYSKLEDNLARVSEQVELLMKNTSSKGFIRNSKITINTAINTLSSLNAAHIRDKFRKISDLFRGRNSFPASGVSSSAEDLHLPFLIDFLSKTVINQGEKLLTPSKPEDAFLLASVIIAIWNEFPDFGPVLLAHFMKRCPYIIPAYWPQIKGQSDKDFYLSRGYSYKLDGTIENQDSFLKRMSGIFMLYVAIMVSVPRKHQQHPHGLRYAWNWLAATVNLDPRSDITAALLYVFLDMAGFKLSQYYRNQFWKIMQLINSEYIVKIEQVTSDDYRGPVSRLKEYVSKVLRDGRFVEPKGILPADYW